MPQRPVAGRSLQPSTVSFGTAINACEAGGCWQLAVHLLEEKRWRGEGSTRVGNLFGTGTPWESSAICC